MSTRRIDVWLVGVGLLMRTGCAGVAAVTATSAMEGMAAAEGPGHAPVTARAPLAAMLASWVVMMVAMMAPTAAPIALTYATVVGRSAQPGGARTDRVTRREGSGAVLVLFDVAVSTGDPATRNECKWPIA